MSDSIVGSIVEIYNTVSTNTGVQMRRPQEISFAGPDDSQPENGKVPCSLFDFAKKGDVESLRQAVRTGGPDVLKQRDRAGHTLAHWAALHGHVSVLQLIIDYDGPFHEASNHELGQFPIHWACVNGYVAVIELLLQAGALVDTVDQKGCTPLIIACQYGKTVVVAYLLGKGANFDHVDKEGDTAIHWAAFKGRSDIVRLLIYSGADPHAADGFGQTPLHLGAISGELNLVRDLCLVDKVQLNQQDRNGKTPLMLAAGRGHLRTEAFLKKEIMERARVMPKIDLKTIVFGPPGNSKGPILFFILSIAFWGYPMYIIRCLPVTYETFPWLHYLFVITNIFMWIALYHANSVDPGYLPRNIEDYGLALKQAGMPEFYSLDNEEGMSQMSRLCHTCRTIKPLRTKHCRICNRCVEHMDHHCPYVYNCIGKNNRMWFHVLVNLMAVLAVMSHIMAFLTIKRTAFSLLLYASYGLLCLGTVMLVITWFYVWMNALQNITTNEMMNKHRYSYLKDRDGKFQNPFNKGWRHNLKEYFHLLPENYSSLQSVHDV